MFIINFADDWIRTADLWCRKQPLYQLSHNHCPVLSCFPSVIDAELSSDPFNLGKNIICQNQKLRNQFLTMYFKYSLRILPLMQFEQKQIFKAYFPKS